MRIEGNLALITGGASGLGAATARHVADLGAQIAIFDTNLAAAEIQAKSLGGLAAEVDVRDDAAVSDAIDQVCAHFGTAPRILVNCAGIAAGARVIDRDGGVSTKLFRKTIDVNLVGTFNVMSHAVRAMRSLEALECGERGVVINTASIAAEDGQVGQTAYAASKGGIAAMTLPAARDLAPLGIRVVSIAPGLFQTAMMEGLPDHVSAEIRENIPFPPRLGQPKEYAQLVESIIEIAYLNGTTVRLDAAVRLPKK